MTTSGPGPDLLSQQLWPPHFLCTPLLSLQTLHSPPCILQSLQACCYSAHLNVNKQQLKRREPAMASSTAAVPFLAPPLEQLRHLAEELRSLLPRVRVGEAQETAEEFNREMFWRRLSECLPLRALPSSPCILTFPLLSPEMTMPLVLIPSPTHSPHLKQKYKTISGVVLEMLIRVEKGRVI